MCHLPPRRRCLSDFVAVGGNSDDDRGLRLAFAASCMPHPEKIKKGGEDSYFACSASRSFGVADGVGGWAESGVDPGQFARRLLCLAHERIEAYGQNEADLQDAFLDAAARLQEEQMPGGTTALLGQLNGTTLSLLNLGDSGAMLLRPALRTPPGADRPLFFPRVVFRSSDQTHYFNCPYQLGSGNAPLEAPDFVRVRVRPGDLVIAATDGVFDNLFDHQVQAIVARHLGPAWMTRAGWQGKFGVERSGEAVVPHLSGLAVSITKQAQRVGQQEDHRDIITPFALSAHSEGLGFRGGKLDDTTVVVGLVCDLAGSEEKQQPLINNF